MSQRLGWRPEQPVHELNDAAQRSSASATASSRTSNLRLKRRANFAATDGVAREVEARERARQRREHVARAAHREAVAREVDAPQVWVLATRAREDRRVRVAEAHLAEVEAFDVHRRQVAQYRGPREQKLVREEWQHVRVVAPVVKPEARELLVFGRPRTRIAAKRAAVGDRGRCRNEVGGRRDRRVARRLGRRRRPRDVSIAVRRCPEARTVDPDSAALDRAAVRRVARGRVSRGETVFNALHRRELCLVLGALKPSPTIIRR